MRILWNKASKKLEVLEMPRITCVNIRCMHAQSLKNYRPIFLFIWINFELVQAIFKVHISFLSCFRRREVEWNLVPCVQQSFKCIDNQILVVAVYTDLFKIFDTLHHPILLMKLENFGVRGCLLRWIISNISNKSQFVVKNRVQL